MKGKLYQTYEESKESLQSMMPPKMMKSNTKMSNNKPPTDDYFRNFEAFISNYEQNMTSQKNELKSSNKDSAFGPIKPGTSTTVVAGRNILLSIPKKIEEDTI